MSTKVALDRLAADADVSTIVVISKPPAADVARAGDAAMQQSLGTPVVMGYLGAGPARHHRDRAARRSPAARRGRGPHLAAGAARPPVPSQGYLRGLFSGGTLCDEAMVIAAEALRHGRVQHPARRPAGARRGLASHGPHLHRLRRRPADRRSRPPDDRRRPCGSTDCARELADDDCGGRAARRRARPRRAPRPGHRAGRRDRRRRQAGRSISVDRHPRRPPGLRRTRPSDSSTAGAVVHASNAAAAREAVSLAGGRPMTPATERRDRRHRRRRAARRRARRARRDDRARRLDSSGRRHRGRARPRSCSTRAAPRPTPRPYAG